MHRARVGIDKYLQAPSSPAFNFGTGDFTLLAMIAARGSPAFGGPIIFRTSGASGFSLAIGDDGAVIFVVADSTGYMMAVSPPPSSLLDGECHTICAKRSANDLSILIDGAVTLVAVTVEVNTPSIGALNVDTSAPLSIGCAPGHDSTPDASFLGGIMNVSLWNVALVGDQLTAAAFGRITGSEPGLQGYWPLCGDGQDLSPNKNTAAAVGALTWEYCLDCLWAYGENAFAFSAISNIPEADASAAPVALSRTMAVASGTPALTMAILADQDAPAFPTGAQVTLVDPSGKIYNQDENTDQAFVVTRGGQPWSVTVLNPSAGAWRVTVTAPGTTAFRLFMQALPDEDVVQTTHRALDPIYGPALPHHLQMLKSREANLDFWNTVMTAAVAAVVVGVGVAASAATGGVAPAVIGVLVALGNVARADAAAVVMVIDYTSIATATEEVGGMAGFLVAVDKFLLIDANVTADRATIYGYQQRFKTLYPKVTASAFNKGQSKLFAEDVTAKNVLSALRRFQNGYVSVCAHGQKSWLTGWLVPGTKNKLQVVLSAEDYDPAARFTSAEVGGRIFHLQSCWCGDALGPAMVEAGAVAFFGYKDLFKIYDGYEAIICALDIGIDLLLMKGATCDEVYNETIAKYDKTLNLMIQAGESQTAIDFIKHNKANLVAPSVDSKYGDKNARLKIT